MMAKAAREVVIGSDFHEKFCDGTSTDATLTDRTDSRIVQKGNRNT